MKHMHFFLKLTIVIVAIITTLPSRAETAKTYTLEDIIEIASAHFEKIEDLEYKFKIRTGTNEAMETRIISTQWVPSKGWERIDQTIYIPNEYSKITKDLEALERQVSAWDGESGKTLNVDPTTDEATQGQTGRNKPASNTINPMTALKLKGGTAPNGKEANYIEYLKLSKNKIEGTEIINGKEMVILLMNATPSVPAKDGLIYRLWLDPERGAMPVRLEYILYGKLEHTIPNIKLKEVEDGIFIPEAFEMISALGDGNRMEFQADPKSIKVNQGLTQASFTVEFKRGLPVWSNDIGSTYYSEIGLTRSTEVDFGEMSKVLEDTEKSFQETHGDGVQASMAELALVQNTQHNSTQWIVWVGIVMAILIVSILVIRYRKSTILILFMTIHLSASAYATPDKIESNCGINSLYILLKLEGKKASLTDLVNAPSVQKEHPNLSLATLKQIAKDYNTDLIPVEIPKDKLISVSSPFIATIENGTNGPRHHIIAWILNNGNVHIIDYPKTGEIEFDIFKEIFTGYALVFKDDMILGGKRNEKTKRNIQAISSKKIKPKLAVTPTAKKHVGSGILWIDSPLVDLGDVALKTKGSYTKTIRFSNSGKSPLTITKVMTSCGCLGATHTLRSIKPGETGEIKITLDISKPGATNQQVILKTTPSSDGLPPVINIRANVLPPSATISLPTVIRFNPIHPAHEYTKNLIVRNVASKKFPKVFRAKRVEVIGDLVGYATAELLAAKPGPESLVASITDYPIRIKIKSPNIYGRHSGVIRVFGDEGEAIDIPLYCQVKTIIRASVKSISFNGKSKDATIELGTKDQIKGFTVLSGKSSKPWLEVVLPNASSDSSKKHEVFVKILHKKLPVNKRVQVGKIKLQGMVDGIAWHLNVPVTLVR